jgi:hypothetical protein
MFARLPEEKFSQILTPFRLPNKFLRVSFCNDLSLINNNNPST